MSKLTAVNKLGGLLTGATKTAGAAQAKVATTLGKVVPNAAKPVSTLGTTASKTSNAASNAAKQAANMQQAYAKQVANMQQAYAKQAAEMQQKLSKQAADIQQSINKALGNTTQSTSKAANTMSRTGSALKTVGLVAGAGAIGLTALGVLGGPGPQDEVPPNIPHGDDTLPWIDGGYVPQDMQSEWWMPENYLPEWLMPEWEVPEWEYPYPDGMGGYTDEEGYYPPAYPDLFGLDPYAQDLLSYAEEVPGVGGLFGALKRSGLALPALIGVGIVIVGGVAFLRSKKGKQMVSGAKKSVSGAVSGAKKAVMG